VTDKALKNRDAMSRECFTDPLFEMSKSIYDKTRAESMQLNGLGLRSSQDFFFPTLDGEARIFQEDAVKSEPFKLGLVQHDVLEVLQAWQDGPLCKELEKWLPNDEDVS
jgi:hypothetical protein